ncbi:hypothetical protein PoB_003258000 [Plakobranchus ocellatus]|uniref:Uncharacterized protein n=1 Tax=Plakobranchus ocellatus TaxID=259542 RepID=A0AAV4AH28_9GAST|nr:hypothetical protein PoB_003258000 [Plakobranchus ocellatus]
MRSSPWFQPRRSESAPPTQRAREPPSISQKEQEEITERISRPTESALYRKSIFWKIDSFMDRGFHSWSKMDLFGDCKRCMWNQNGTVKASCKIRPILTSTRSSKNFHLPPLASSEDYDRSCGMEKLSSRDGRPHTERERSHCSLMSGRKGRDNTPNEGKQSSNLCNGLLMLDSVSGARYRVRSRPVFKQQALHQNRNSLNIHA